MSLHIAPGGQAELDITSSWSLPPDLTDTLGRFAMVLEPARLAKLAELVEAGDLMDQGPGEPPTSPDSTTRTLTLARDGEERQITLAGALEEEQPKLAAMERLLLEILADVAKQPVSAARATWELTPEGDGVRPTVTITHVGTEPMPVLFLDPEQAGFRMRAVAWFESEVVFPGGSSAWNTVGREVNTQELLEQLVRDGTLPSGEQQLAVGATLRFSLPVLAPPADAGTLRVHGSLDFYRLGPGLARGLLNFDLAGLPVPAP
jgi:hypothetical protein